MIVKMALCASVLLSPPAPQDARKPTEADKPAQVEKSITVEAQTSKAAADAKERPVSSAAQQSQQNDLLAIEANIVKYTNAERSRYGLAALEVDADLMNSARSHASWMARSRNMVHTSRPVAENIAMGQPHSRLAVRDWMNSSGHRANILNRSHRRIGAAAYRTPDGRIYWCQQFRR